MFLLVFGDQVKQTFWFQKEYQKVYVIKRSGTSHISFKIACEPFCLKKDEF